MIDKKRELNVFHPAIHDFRIRYAMCIVILILGYIYLFISNSFSELKIPLCLFKKVTGIPCPACGSTRATIALLHGNLIESFLLNPLAIFSNLFIVMLIIFMARDIIQNKERVYPALKKERSKKLIFILVPIIMTLWIWNIVRGI